jgi:putative SOS response-associated peptidase YedK
MTRLEALQEPKTEHWEKTFAILTGDPNGFVAHFHDRMTIWVLPHDYEEYLIPAEASTGYPRLPVRPCGRQWNVVSRECEIAKALNVIAVVTTRHEPVSVG